MKRTAVQYRKAPKNIAKAINESVIIDDFPAKPATTRIKKTKKR